VQDFQQVEKEMDNYLSIARNSDLPNFGFTVEPSIDSHVLGLHPCSIVEPNCQCFNIGSQEKRKQQAASAKRPMHCLGKW
jgi:hypothetical protein